ncbi:MAG: heparan-alpha-glucosaminide N-acetyltransferase domain-containing protein [Vicinamibacteria bacterium]
MSRPGRLGYVDWMRGLAVLLMFQTHVYDSWLQPEAHHGFFFRWSRFFGGYPAVLFLFLAGLSLAFVAESRITHGATPAHAAIEGARRGAELFGYALLFRLWMFISGGFSRPRDLLRVDVLNCLGLSMSIVACLCIGRSTARRRLGAALGLATSIALLTPLAWDGPWPEAMPRVVLAYVSGRPAGAFFPLFPWCAFVAAGAAAGGLLARHRQAGGEERTMLGLAGVGASAIASGILLDRLPQVYPRYDFWWTSPNYVAIKVGVALLILIIAWLWGRRPTAGHPSPLRQLGRTSLLVYWVHIEIVYGAVVAPWARQRLSLAGASLGLLLLSLSMLALSAARTRGFRRRAGGVIPGSAG